MECGVEPASAYATASSICCQATLIRTIVEYGSRKLLLFSSQSTLDMTAYVA